MYYLKSTKNGLLLHVSKSGFNGDNNLIILKQRSILLNRKEKKYAASLIPKPGSRSNLEQVLYEFLVSPLQTLSSPLQRP
jgi:hypothetical protein